MSRRDNDIVNALDDERSSNSVDWTRKRPREDLGLVVAEQCNGHDITWLVSPLPSPIARPALRSVYDTLVEFVTKVLDQDMPVQPAEPWQPSRDLCRVFEQLDLVCQILLQQQPNNANVNNEDTVVSKREPSLLSEEQEIIIQTTHEECGAFLKQFANDALPARVQSISSWYTAETQLYHWNRNDNNALEPTTDSSRPTELGDDDDQDSVLEGNLILAAHIDRQALAEEEELLLSMANTPIPT